MNIKQFIYLATALLVLGGCSEDLGTGQPVGGEAITVDLSLQPSGMTQVNLSGSSSSSALKATRSITALTDDAEKVINNLWVFQYVGGTYVRGQYLSQVNASKLNLDLSKATGATIYFVANVGEAAYKGKTLATETDFKNSSLSITNEASITPSAGSLPMFGEVTSVAIPDYFKGGATVTMTYMVSRVDLSYEVTSNMSSDFQIKQARLINVPRYMYPYINPENMDADDTNDTNFPADTLTTVAFARENIAADKATSGTLTFYLPDNRRGLGDNTAGSDATQKAGIAKATAVQLIGNTNGAEVIYNIYLGEDQYNDYNLKRNTKYTLTAQLDGTSTNDARVVGSGETANCYIVKPGGMVLIPVRRANQSDLGEQLADVTTGWTPGVLWRDNSDLMITATDAGNGMMEVTASSATAIGNALVYIKKAGSVSADSILWSWHIWVTDYDPETENQTYPAIDGYTFMDRNIGALNDTPGDAGALGLMYQWGRKDPFAGSSATNSSTLRSLYSDGTDNKPYPSTNTAAPTDVANNLENAIRNPGVFYFNTGVKKNDWYCGSSTTQNSTLWGITKTVYDPCPSGWKVALREAFSSFSTTTFLRNGTTAAEWDALPGRFLDNESTGSWFPSNGYRNSGSGILSDVAKYGCYWSSAFGIITDKLLFTNSTVSPHFGAFRADGYAVRCVQED